MSEAAEKSKAIDEEVDDTDEVDGVFEPCKVSYLFDIIIFVILIIIIPTIIIIIIA